MPGKIAQLTSPREALESLCEWFYEDRLSAEGCEPVLPEAMPAVSRNLLVHHEHMTRRLETYHGGALELRVLHHRLEGNLYVRNIELVARGGEHVVEFGIVRLDLEYTPQSVREEILARKRPLGDILIEHDVLRRIEPRWYFRFERDSPIAAHFGGKADVYGRLGTIYCDEQPAIELLEVVTEARAPK